MDNSASPSIFPLEGGCACGFVRYRLETRPLIIHCCHCTSCQRETGSAFAINAVIESALVTRLPSAQPSVPASSTQASKPAGPPLSRSVEDSAELEIITTPSESGRGQRIVRCPACKVAVWSHYGTAGSRTRFIRVGTLDEAWKVQPDVHIYTQSKRGFFKLDGSIPAFNEFYPSREGIWRKESIDRWEEVLKIEETV